MKPCCESIQKHTTEHRIWKEAVEAAAKEAPARMEGHRVVHLTRAQNQTQPELTDDRPAIRQALREARERRGVKVRSQLF